MPSPRSRPDPASDPQPGAPAAPPTLTRRLQRSGAAVLLAALAWGALAPLHYPTRDLEVGLGSARRTPAELRLALGVRDVLLLRNRDRKPHVFGQVQVAPGHAFRLPFDQAGTSAFACDTASGGQVVVRVDPYPDPGWERLAWRLRALADAVRTTAPRRPED